MSKTTAHTHFALIELLVISIIFILATLLLPAITLVNTAAKWAACASNQRQLVVAIIYYGPEGPSNKALSLWDNEINYQHHPWVNSTFLTGHAALVPCSRLAAGFLQIVFFTSHIVIKNAAVDTAWTGVSDGK